MQTPLFPTRLARGPIYTLPYPLQYLHPCHPPHHLQPSPHPLPAYNATHALPTTQQAKPQKHLRARDEDTDQDQDDDNPRQARHLRIGDTIREDLGEVEEDATPLVEDLDARFDLQVFAHGVVEGVQRGFGVPEEGRGVEDVGC